MLNHITIHNFVLIRDIHIDLSDRFNVFTGETGAGKSLLVDALNFVAGERSSSKIVGLTDSKARVEVSFSFPLNHKVMDKLKDLDLFEDDGSLIISREMHQDGRNVCRINMRTVTLSIVRSLLDGVLDVHSQHETQYLLDQKNHGLLVDHFAKLNTDSFNLAFKAYKERDKAYQSFKESEFNPSEIEFAVFQLEEITKLNPSVEDFETVEQKINEMKNFEKFKSVYDRAHTALNYQPGIVGALYDVVHDIKELEDLDFYERFNDVYLQLEDLRDDLGSRNDDLSFDSYEFDALQSRMVGYTALRRKYGSIDGIVEKQEQLESQIHASSHYDDLLEDKRLEREAAYGLVYKEAESLRTKRLKAAKKLESLVLDQLHDLMLDQAKFEIKFAEKALDSKGIDDVVFCVSMNKGMSPEPMNQVASGGELSRLMLGLKVIFSKIYGISTLVFDEIDTGVSGRVGMMMGSKMKALSKESQVLTITHLPSVAACADHHYLISKDHGDLETITSVDLIQSDDRIDHLAMIMSGIVSDASRSAAKELLGEGQSI